MVDNHLNSRPNKKGFVAGSIYLLRKIRSMISKLLTIEVIFSPEKNALEALTKPSINAKVNEQPYEIK